MTEAVRVAYTIEQCWHEVPGGTAVAGIGMARALAARGDVELVGVAAYHRSPPAPGWEPGIDVRHVPLPRVALYESWLRLRRPRVERAAGRVDVVHATTIAVPPRSAPLVVTMHDVAWRAGGDFVTRRGRGFFERGLAVARRDADLVLCPSRATADDCARAGFDPARLRVVPLGVDAPRATAGDVERVRARYGLTRPYVLFAGTIEPRKNLARLVEAFRTLDDGVDLALVGPRGWNEDLDALVRPARARVKALGFVPHADLGPLYAGAAVFCMPSLLEGFGFPVLEAMAQGTPVVTSRGTSTEEVAGDAAVLVDPRDPGSIARGLAAVLGDDALARKLSDAGPARAAEYTWERTAAGVASCYREVAA
ncbi:MAG TPA: glycosyltransferase family 1 protein [Actinomycetota bacterium]|nr:glycosyltransferase family 1 protein [Actinomycetota bacterium]